VGLQKQSKSSICKSFDALVHQGVSKCSYSVCYYMPLDQRV
jgi:hypothetical protein